MRRGLGLIGVALGLAIGGGARAAWAQAPGDAAFDPELLAVSADPDAIGVADGARTQTPGTIGVAAIFHVAGPVLHVCLEDGAVSEPPCDVEGDLLRTRLRAELGFLYGFGRLDVRVQLPVMLHQTTDVTSMALASAGVGDPRLAARARLVRRGAIALAAELAATIPTGGGDFLGDDGVIVDPRLLFDARRGRVAAGVNLGYRHRQDAVRLGHLYVDDELTWSAAAEYWIVPDRLAAGAAVLGRVGLVDAPADAGAGLAADPVGPEERPAEALASVRVFLAKRWAIDLAGGGGITSGYGAPPFRVIAGVRWIDRKPDPAAAARARIADRDRDGLRDLDDRCPADPEDRDGYRDDDGCPEPDNDEDGVLDGADRCPLDPEDIDGHDDADGCPDLDDDADQVEDAHDECPGEAEDVDQVDDGDGCPETDADRDGILDPDDRCPTIPELYDGVGDEDGCPDDARPAVAVEGHALVIRDAIFFELDRARLEPASEPALAAVAAFLAAHPALRIRVEGHADDRGKAGWNLDLSRQRAAAVRARLIELGVAADRLAAEGYGATRPRVQGTSEAARAQNRRVELVIVDEPTPSP